MFVESRLIHHQCFFEQISNPDNNMMAPHYVNTLLKDLKETEHCIVKVMG